MNRARFLGLFVDEARDHVTSAFRELKRFEALPQSPDAIRALMRHCHSLKGMAATMGFEPFLELAHRMEGLLRELEDRPRMWTDELAPLFAEGLDHLAAWAEQVAEGRSPEHTVATRTLVARLDSLLSDGGGRRPTAAISAPDSERPAHWSVRLALQVSSTSPTHRILTTLKRVATIGRVLRVRPPQLPIDQGPAAMTLELEIASARSPKALRRRLGQLAWIAEFELTPIPRRDDVPARVEMPSEWTRVPAESLDWIADTLRELALHHTLRRDDERRSAADRSGYLIKRVHDRVTELRLVPLMSLGHRLEPAVRDAARREGKTVRFALTGGDVGVERGLLDRLVEPLRHLVRNAVAHGIETPDEREAAGKPREGLIRLTVARHGERLHLELTDDGRGMDPEALRKAAIEAGEIDAPRAETLSRQESLRLAFLAAVTTRENAGPVAGRGAGLDVVADAFRALESSCAVSSVAGEGTRFVFELPLHSATVRSLVFSRGGQVFAVPLRSIRRATSSGAAPISDAVVDLGQGAGAVPDDGFYLEVDRVGRPVVLLADEVLGQRDLWLQPLARPFSEATWVNGAAILDQGTMALMIDPEKLTVEEPVAG